MQEGDLKTVSPQLHRSDTLATRIIGANRSATLSSTIVVLVAMFFACCSALSVIYTRPTKVDHGALVDNNNRAIGTSKTFDLVDLMTVAALGPDYDFHAIETITLDVTDPANGTFLGTYGARTMGFFWYNATDIDFYLLDGNTLHISSDAVGLEPTVRTAFGMTPVETRRRALVAWLGVVKQLLKPWKAHAPSSQQGPQHTSCFATNSCGGKSGTDYKGR